MRTAVRRHARALSWRARAALAALAMVGLVVLGGAVSRGDGAPAGALERTPPVTADRGYWPPIPPPGPVRTSPPAAPPTSAPAPAGPERGVAAPTSPAGEKVRATPSTSPPAPGLTPGTRIGLEPVTHPGYRVRHRQFRGRIDPVGAGSPALDRADSTFTVRAGLADPRCVSLEAVNYPGYYLRHQDFAIHLHRRDPSALFAADATFCPRAGLAGRDVSLRSYNYPDRHLYHERSRLFIAASGERAAMTFAVRSAL
ncbi:AbfB domain-containing protein [Phytohabitans sp. ZYX-F-186]|uniref:AbfB domain-containing protein n=1 Tax=Phytohabitans maris TaxID=3071409 RepID=A0ABU0ZUB5_9ACTN|nr:AbfB domain-containing protein [Phytohabitans sp. ZYX-F-186]MDQ7910635.1 AbfB domain-containing protein [Phytohabitans sp. ZYX-F-186]